MTIKDRLSLIFGLCFFLFSTASFGAYPIKYLANLRIGTVGGIQLAANVYYPVSVDTQIKFPVIIFANSWILGEHEYVTQAKSFAREGYVVLSYSARGWGKSGGVIDVASPDDVRDISLIIDWLDTNKTIPVDTTRIGMAGISYGAGLALLGAEHDSRIKVVAAMSGWGSLIDALYGGDTPSGFWAGFLVLSGSAVGHLSSDVKENYLNLLLHVNVPQTLAWAKVRSPLTFIKNLNLRNIPVYLSNNFEDRLFKPNYILAFYTKLTGPKHLDLNQGVHASAEIGGLFSDKSNFVWRQVHAWFDHYLKHINNGIDKMPPITMQLRNKSVRETFLNWPSTKIASKLYYLSPRHFSVDGKLETDLDSNINSYGDTLYSGLHSGVTSGIPIVSPLEQAYIAHPITVDFSKVSRRLAIIYESKVFSHIGKIRGTPQVILWIKPESTKLQVIAYLYDVGINGIATLITHGPATVYNASINKIMKLNISLRSAAYNIPKGDKLALVLTTHDVLYKSPTLLPYDLKIEYATNKQPSLIMPFEE